MRFPVEIVRRARALVGDDFPIMYRISLLDLVEDGQTWEETLELAALLQETGVTVFNTGIGWHEARVPTIITQVPRAAWVSATARLKAAVSVPVCASNRINTPEVAESILAAGQADLVSMARPLLADPEFVVKAAAGRADEINTCIACNQACLDHVFGNEMASCLVNPRACRETTLVLDARPSGPTHASRSSAPGRPAARPRSRPRSAASRSPCSRRATRVGGQFRLAMHVPGKEEFAETLRYFTRRLEVLGVDVRLSHRGDRRRPRVVRRGGRRHRRRAADPGAGGHRPPERGVVRRRARRHRRPRAAGSRWSAPAASASTSSVFLTHEPGDARRLDGALGRRRPVAAPAAASPSPSRGSPRAR